MEREKMSNSGTDKDPQEEESEAKREEDKNTKIPDENKTSRLAERKGQRPAFPFKRKPL